MCELYCPADALYVAPTADAVATVAEAPPVEEGFLGSYRRALGWQPGSRATAAHDRSHALLEALAR